MRLAVFFLFLLVCAPLSADTLVAATTIRGSVAIGPDDVAIQPGTTPGALSSPSDAIGMEARVNLYPGRPIRESDLRPPAVIDRNEIVTVEYSAGGISIVTEGRALDRAAAGERLRVLNLTSRTTVSAIAIGPGRATVGDLP